MAARANSAVPAAAAAPLAPPLTAGVTAIVEHWRVYKKRDAQIDLRGFARWDEDALLTAQEGRFIAALKKFNPGDEYDDDIPLWADSLVDFVTKNYKSADDTSDQSESKRPRLDPALVLWNLTRLDNSDNIVGGPLPNWDSPHSVVQLSLPPMSRLNGMAPRAAPEIAFAVRKVCQETVKKLSPYLKTGKKADANIIGCPGSGKTLFLWAFSLDAFLKLGSSVLFVLSDDAVFYLDARSKCVSILVDGANGTATPASFAYNRVLIQSLQVDLVVIDGVDFENIDNWIKETNWVSYRLCIFSSSVGATPKQQIMQGRRKLTMDVKCKWPSWTLDEYKAVLPTPLQPPFMATLEDAVLDELRDMCQTDTVPPQLDESAFREAIIDKKYYYAGGSARYFFDCNISTIISILLDLIATVKDFSTLLNPPGGVAGATFAHGLIQRFWLDGETNLLISQFAHRETLKAMLNKKQDPIAFADAFAEIAEKLKNPAVSGWALESTYDAQLRARSSGLPPYSSELSLRYRRLDDGPSLSVLKYLIPKDTYVTLDPRPGSPCEFMDLFQHHGLVWMHPKDWNQGCYDFAMVKKRVEDTAVDLTTFQCTRSVEHSIKPDFLAYLIDWVVEAMRLEVKTLTHIALTSRDNFEAFDFKPPTNRRLRFYTGHGMTYSIGAACLDGI
eukprot:m.207413 g.207413  ORF g.207413 m.207413 type:complete len:672 (-) comp10126_c0_seq12:1376-3391(-)